MTFQPPKPRSKRHALVLAKMQAEMDEINAGMPTDLQYASPPGTNPKTWWGEAWSIANREETTNGL